MCTGGQAASGRCGEPAVEDSRTLRISTGLATNAADHEGRHTSLMPAAGGQAASGRCREASVEDSQPLRTPSSAASSAAVSDSSTLCACLWHLGPSSCVSRGACRRGCSASAERHCSAGVRLSPASASSAMSTQPPVQPSATAAPSVQASDTLALAAAAAAAAAAALAEAPAVPTPNGNAVQASLHMTITA